MQLRLLSLFTYLVFLLLFITSVIVKNITESINKASEMRNTTGRIIQRASEASEADYQSCSIEISDININIYIREFFTAIIYAIMNIC